MLNETIESAVFRKTETTFELNSFDEDKLAVSSVMEQTRTQINIYSHVLCPSIFNTQLVLDACERFCLKDHRSTINILINDSRPITRVSHRLLALSHRYSSSIFLKKINPLIESRGDDFVCFDKSAYFQLPNYEHYESLCNFSDAQRTSDFLMFFNDAWERSELDPELRSVLL
jgi:hypothetical protein